MKIGRRVNFNGGRIEISDDPKGVLRVFITSTISDMLNLPSQDMKVFLRRFDPNGKGYTVYDTASGYLVDVETGENVKEGDWWDIVVDSPLASVTISGEELRSLFRQAIIGKLPHHPELKNSYEDL